MFLFALSYHDYFKKLKDLHEGAIICFERYLQIQKMIKTCSVNFELNDKSMLIII